MCHVWEEHIETPSPPSLREKADSLIPYILRLTSRYISTTMGSVLLSVEGAMRQALMARCHNSLGCKDPNEQLEDSGFCKGCGTMTDIKDALLVPFCPDCKCKLEGLVCTRCDQTFEKPRA
jgi:hypothetical protein